MKPSLRDRSLHSAQRSLIRTWRFIDLFRAASSRTLIRTSIAVAAAWLPPAVLSAFRGSDSSLSFLTDYATQSRFLIILPVLILAERPLRQRLALVAHHFEGIVPTEQRPDFQAEWNFCDRMRDSAIVRILIVALTYATAAFLSQYLSPTGVEFTSWWTGGGGFRAFSLAGSWAFFVSYPILAYFTYLWIWRQLLWARFLRSTTHMELRLIAAHPDRVGGLGFLEGSLLAQIPFCFCLGVGLAGAVANRVFHAGEPVLAFRFAAVALIGVALLFCVGPYLLFIRILMQMRRRGMSTYGPFARAVGYEFEKKWLSQTENLNEEVLAVPDFATTANLFRVVANIDNVRIVPVAVVNLYAIAVATLIPGLPVLIAAIPFNILIRAAMKLLF